MHQEQRDKTVELLRRKGVERALFADPANITWLTGVPQPWRPGAYLYSGGPSLLWLEDGEFTLIMMDGHVMGGHAGEIEAFRGQPDCQLLTYQGYAYQHQPAGKSLLAETLKNVVKSFSQSTIGFEADSLPSSLLNVMREVQPKGTIVEPIDGWLSPLRIIRTGEELVKMRENFALIGAAQAACKEAVRPGRSELDVWHAIHSTLQNQAGVTLPLGNDCVVGRRMGGPAEDIEIKPRDSFIVDLSTLWKGYWSDSCVTYYADDPSPEQVKMHRATAEALDLAISLAKPGAVCREIDQSVRKFLTDQGYATYPHHTGHGIGVVGHEAPRVTPHSDERLQEGMVVMLEPGIYIPRETGVRLEHAVLIGDSGPEILTSYDLNIP